MSEMENKADTKKTEVVYKSSNEIAMAGLVEALNKCDSGDLYARNRILEAMKTISDNESKDAKNFAKRTFDAAGYISENWGLYLCAYLGGKAVVTKVAQWFRNRKK